MTRLIVLLLFLFIAFTSQAKALGAWSTLPEFTQRHYHKTVLIGNNSVLSIGGETTSPISWVNQLTNSSNTWAWSDKARMSIGRSYHTATKLDDGKVLVTGGVGSTATSSSIQNTTEIYNPVTNTWHNAGLMNSPRTSHTATLLNNGKVLIIGGLKSNTQLTDSTDIVDTSIIPHAWDIKAPLPAKLGAHTATLVSISGNDYVFVAGGGIITSNVNTTYLYDIANNLWSAGPNLTSPRVNHTATRLKDGRVLIVGSNNTADIWNPDTNSITQAASMIHYRRSHTAELLNDGRVMIAGGYGGILGVSGSSALPSVEIYDPVNNTWTLDKPMTTARFDHASTKLEDGRIVVSGGTSTGGNTGTVEIYTPEAITPTSTPTPTPTTTPTPTSPPTPTPLPGPEPFLELPWNYQANGSNFEEAALAINAFFDHTYPLSYIGSSNEPAEERNTTTGFDGLPKTWYSAHDGYDWGRLAKTKYDTPVLAAASGSATYVGTCTACGNQIRIDHGNGYQTRYYHLQDTQLITSSTTEAVQVVKGQQIGLVGFSGNVSPAGQRGSHIHFTVVEDKDGDGNFDNNMPDGLTDPFGWQSNNPDPWENYSFDYLKKALTGNKSYYLWTTKLSTLDKSLTANGGIFTLNNTQIIFPENSINNNVTLSIKPQPIVQKSLAIESILPSIKVTAKDIAGNLVTTFTKPFTLAFYFASADLRLYKTATIAIYSSLDGENWTKEITNVDLANKKASIEIDHLTYFAVMAERSDITSPTTTPIFTGDKGTGNAFRSDVILSLNAEDNIDGLGVEHTFYKLGDEEWKEYTGALSFNSEGTHQIQYYSIDKDENIENIKTTEFNIDKSIPEISSQFDITKLDITYTGHDTETVAITEYPLTNNIFDISASDTASNTAQILVAKKINGSLITREIKSLTYNSIPSFTLPKNQILIVYAQNKDKSLKNLVQSLLIKDQVALILSYDVKNNRTTVFKNDGSNTTSTILNGLKLLKLTTDKGTLKYSY